MAGPPEGTEWVVYFDAKGDALRVDQRDPQQNTLVEVREKYDVMGGSPPPPDYQFVGAKDMGEFYVYRDGAGSLHMYRHFYCKLYCL